MGWFVDFGRCACAFVLVYVRVFFFITCHAFRANSKHWKCICDKSSENGNQQMRIRNTMYGTSHTLTYNRDVHVIHMYTSRTRSWSLFKCAISFKSYFSCFVPFQRNFPFSRFRFTIRIYHPCSILRAFSSNIFPNYCSFFTIRGPIRAYSSFI